MTIETYAWIVNGAVQNIILWDGNTDTDSGGLSIPEGDQLVPVLEGQQPFIGLGATLGKEGIWEYEQPKPVERTNDEVTASNIAQRNRLLDGAARAIAPLQDAVDLGSKQANQELLKSWKQFRVAVNSVNLTETEPAWPVPPQGGYD